MLLDYGTSRPTLSTLRGLGVTGVGRYIGWDSVPGYSSIGKNITRDEARALLGAGIEIFLAFEYAKDAAARGAEQGRKDGQLAMQQLADLGAPPDMGVYFAVDYDLPDCRPDLPDTAANARAKLGPVGDYFAAISGLKHPYQVGGYGGYYAIKRLFDAGLITLGWQTIAWSGGKTDSRSHIYQSKVDNGPFGSDVDVRCHMAVPNYGQWSNAPLPKPGWPAEQEEDVTYSGQIGPGEKVGVPVVKGTTNRVCVYADYTNSTAPMKVRVAVLSETNGYSQIQEAEISAAKPEYILFKEKDVVAVSFQRVDTVPGLDVGYFVTGG